jgi:CRP/FNR family transcriptional regulator, cyclic AMP receptor protein
MALGPESAVRSGEFWSLVIPHNIVMKVPTRSEVDLATERTNKLAYLSMVEIFQDLDESEMKYIDQVTTMVATPKGRVFFDPYASAEVLFILKKGDVSLYRINPEGKKLVTARLTTGSIFGEMAVLGQRMHEAYAEAMSDCLVCVMNRSEVEKLLLQHPRIAMRLAESLGRRLAEVEARLEDMAFKSVSGRLASLLLRLADETDWRGRPVITGLTHQQLAELIGSYRETVTMTLNEFKDSGCVSLGRRKIVIVDEHQLATIAKA